MMMVIIMRIMIMRIMMIAHLKSTSASSKERASIMDCW
jgi:hypothetical protein